jgi:hypothetical protein
MPEVRNPCESPLGPSYGPFRATLVCKGFYGGDRDRNCVDFAARCLERRTLDVNQNGSAVQAAEPKPERRTTRRLVVFKNLVRFMQVFGKYKIEVRHSGNFVVRNADQIAKVGARKCDPAAKVEHDGTFATKGHLDLRFRVGWMGTEDWTPLIGWYGIRFLS